MQTLEYNHEDFQPSRQNEADKALLVKFFNKTKQDMIASEREKRPVFHEVVYVSIDVPGNRLGGACHPATQRDVERFPLHYQAFKNRTADTPETLVGMPLVEWPKITRSQAEELAFLKIRTVEQLAEVSDGNSGQIMNFYDLKTKAKAWLLAAAENKSAEHLQAELAKRDEQIALLQAQMAELLAQKAEAPRGTSKRKPGRPKKFVPVFLQPDAESRN